MGYFKKLFSSKNRKDDLTKEELIEINVCPNCWGRQEYQDEFYKQDYDSTKANINHDKSHQKAFIQQFVEDQVTGIILKSENGKMRCKACQSGYKKLSK